MRARLDLYGNGDARGTHMSIFIVISRGNYDAIVSWPFAFPVVFCLFDQTGQGHHIIDSIHPHPTSVSFQRPQSDQNIPSGKLKFVPLAILQQQGGCYIQEDKMFIKIMVDFFQTPREILPYTLSIDPTLPIAQQEAIRCGMIERFHHARTVLIAMINQNEQELAARSLIPVFSRIPQRPRQQPTSFTTTTVQCAPCEEILPNKE